MPGPPAGPGTTAAPSDDAAPAARRGGSSRRVWALVAAAVLVLVLASLLAPSTATYDPWAWIIWGREVVHGDLDTVTGPSWKPLPVVVTSIASLFGDAAPVAWIVVARAGTLAAVVFAFLVGRRIAGTVGGLFAAVPLLLAPWFFWNGWLANSEGLLVALVLAGVLAELEDRRGLAMTCGVGAALLRPEAWPFLLLYAAWVARRTDGRGRLAVLGGLAVLPPAWLLPEKWGSGDFWRAATRAKNPDPGAASLTAHPWWTIVTSFVHMLPLTSWCLVVASGIVLGALAMSGRGAREAPAKGRANPWNVVATIALAGLAWLALVAVMTERGYSGNERYLIQPAALLIVAGGATAGLVLRRLPGLPRPVLAAIVAVAGVGAVVVAASELPGQVREVVYEGRLVHDLPDAIRAAGGADRLRACGQVSTLNLMVPQVAWQLRQHAVDVRDAKFARTPVVLRLRLQKGDIMRPSVGRVPSLPMLARTPYWQIEAGRCPGPSPRTR